MNKELDNPNNLREIEREIVSALIFSRDGKLLMGKKDPSKGGVYANAWHIPGGGSDNDLLEEALIREVKEETGLDIQPEQIQLVDDSGRGSTEKTLKDTRERVWCNMRFNVFKVELQKESDKLMLNPTDDLVELKWLNIEEIKDYELTPPSVELFKRLGYLS
jgi:8-oxo-dGTP pyrophosphatase MutT (NUDIX family)